MITTRTFQRLKNWLRCGEVCNPPQVDPDAAKPEPYEEPWPSLELIYEVVKARVADQNDHIKWIDTKASFGLAAGTLVTASVAALSGALRTSSDTGSAKYDQDTFLLLSVGHLVNVVSLISVMAFALVVYSAYQAYRIRNFEAAPGPELLVNDYVDDLPRFTKAVVTQAMAKSFARNKAVIETKVCWVERTMRFVIIEVLSLVAVGLVQIIWL